MSRTSESDAGGGAARHLAGARIPSVLLTATSGERIDLPAIPGRVSQRC
ncbi:MAG TPA: hypothetical protein VIY55_02310 [Acetobacteraceae bacterium]|jgi:hypothetical protein